jgi:serine protease Do
MRSATILLGVLLSTSLVAEAHAQRLWAEKSNARALQVGPDIAGLAKEVVPAVVSIQVDQTVRSPHGRGQGMQDPFDFFFRPFGDIPREFHGRGLGTGFVIQKDGLILTNYHVVENADAIEVTFALADGSERKMGAKVLGVAPQYDVALIQTEGKANAPIAYLGDSAQTNIGDWVMAVGNPFGLTHTVSVGIISAKERRDIMPSGRRGYYDFLQTDAAINPGNSGGPLVNMAGEVIGINSAINAAGSGIGFAIPINMVKEMLPDLKEKGKFTRSWIGIRIQQMNPELAEGLGLSRPSGALVAEVVPGGPAEAAGLEEGDVILEFDGKPVRDNSDLPLYASMAGVGKRVNLKVWRDKKERAVRLTLAEYPDEEMKIASGGESGGGELGMTVTNINPELQQRLGIEISRGVVIKDLSRGSPAARAGLRVGDGVLSLNGKRATTARDFARAVRALKAGAVMRMQVARRGGRLFVAMRKP